MPVLFRDFETKSTLDLRDVGTWKYASHPTTDVWCAAFAVDDGPISLWVPGDPVPAEFIEAAENPRWLVSAFNDAFERAIEQLIMGPRYGWTLTPIERHRCLQAAALALALPASLKGAARALGLEQQKDAAGRNTMLRMARPRKPRRDEDPAGIYWFDDIDRRAQLYAYCKQDLATERALHERVGELCPAEQNLWQLDAIINARGLHLDTSLLTAAINIADAAQMSIAKEMAQITDGAVTSVDQVAALLAWLRANGCEVPDVRKTTMEMARTRADLSATTRRIIELRLDGAHAAANKLSTMRAWCNGDDRVRGAFRYHGASTGRWTSFGIQLQNLKRPQTEDLAGAITAIATGDLAQLRDKYPQPMAVIGDIARAVISAAPGHRLIAADLSGIESRITAWVSGQQSKLAQWAKFDWSQDSHDEPYFLLGKTLGLPAAQARSVGKTADLAFGYMGGAGAWRKLAGPDDTATEAEIKARQQAWRDAHPETTRFWYALDKAAVRAIQKPGAVIACKRVAFEYDGQFLFMRLPSGRRIAYPFAKLITNDHGEPAVVFMDNDKGRWVECRHGHGAYGGTWIENAVQAIARDLFAAAMPRLEAAGYSITLHVHDEIVAEVPEGFGSEEDFLRVLTMPPTWADGLPIAAKVRNGQRFAKINSAPVIVPAPVGAPASIDVPAPASPCEATMPDKEDYQDRRNGYPAGEREWGDVQAQYIYRNAAGENYLRVTRTSAKQFPQSHWEGGRWVKGKPAGPRIPYRLPELIAAAATEPIFVCEGEKDAEHVAELGLTATTNPEGAGKWSEELNNWFVGKPTVYVLEDNDDAGRRHAAGVAAQLVGIVPNVRIVSFSELPAHGDVSDWIDQGGSKAQLLERAKTARVPPPPGGSYTLVRASDVVTRALKWRWVGHLLDGTLELMAGPPGKGKSQVHCSHVATVTTGRAWPEGSKGSPASNVIMMTAEDCLDQILVPRLIAAGANLTRVHILKKIRKDDKERMFLLAEDLALLAEVIANVGEVGLVTIDPITAYMGGKLDSHRTTDVRSQLGPLQDLAERIDVAFSAITHPAKNAGPRAIDHFIGSQAFVAAARIGHLCVEEMEETESGQRQATGRMLFTNPKNNPYTAMPTIAYRISQTETGADTETGETIIAPRIVWEEAVAVTADEAIAATTPAKDRQGGVVTFVQDMLTNGPVLVTVVEERAAVRGFSWDRVKRAKGRMGVVSYKNGLADGWFWALPQHVPPGVTTK